MNECVTKTSLQIYIWYLLCVSIWPSSEKLNYDIPEYPRYQIHKCKLSCLRYHIIYIDIENIALNMKLLVYVGSIKYWNETNRLCQQHGLKPTYWRVHALLSSHIQSYNRRHRSLRSLFQWTTEGYNHHKMLCCVFLYTTQTHNFHIFLSSPEKIRV